MKNPPPSTIQTLNLGHNYGVVHHITPVGGPLRHILEQEVGLTVSAIETLLELGAVYVDGHRVDQQISQILKKNDYIRVHSQPRRFPRDVFQPQTQVIYENDDFLVYRKPSGIPVHPTVDNSRENLLTWLNETFGRTFFITHRLDIPTRGLIVYAKNTTYQKKFNSFLQNRKIQKIYRARVMGTEQIFPNFPYLVTHFMEPSPRAPKKVSRSPMPGWTLCELEILELQRKTESTFDLKIRLLTGRTHQIRCQLADLGLPICGDHLYGAKSGPTPTEEIDLECCELSFPEDYSFKIEGGE